MKFWNRSYKKKLGKFFAGISTGILLFSSVPAETARTQTPPPAPYAGTELSVARCLSRGNFEFRLMLRSIAYVNGFSQTFLEPFRDVFARNQCQSADILRLLEDGDRMRKAIRNAYITCAPHKLPPLKDAYNRLVAELYYVRHVVSGGVVVSTPFNILQTRIGSEATKTPSNELYERMRQKFVNAYFFSPLEFEALWAELSSKYRERKETYIECEDGDWTEVKKKWEEFKTFFTEDLGEQIKTGVHDLRARAKVIGEEAATLRTVELVKGLYQGDTKAAVDFAQSMVQVNIDGFEAKEGAGRIGDHFQKVGQDIARDYTGMVSPPTQEEVSRMVATEGKAYDFKKMKHNIRMEFTMMYFEVSDQSSEILLSALDGRGADEPGLLQILDSTMPVLYTMKDKTRSIYRKQCP